MSKSTSNRSTSTPKSSTKPASEPASDARDRPMFRPPHVSAGPERSTLYDAAHVASREYHETTPRFWGEPCLMSPTDLAYSALAPDPMCPVAGIITEVSALLDTIAGDDDDPSPLTITLRAAVRRLDVASELAMRGVS